MHKVCVLIVVVGMYSACVQKCRDREKKYVSICALHLSVGMSLSRQGSFRMHMSGGVWRVEGVGGLWSGGFLVVLDVSGPEPECHIPLSG